jgi:molecular chaperone HscC
VKSFSTVNDFQEILRIEVFQGEHAIAAHNVRLGSCELRGIPKKPAGEEAVDVRFTYDLNGILEVEARVRSTGAVESVVIEGRPGRMSTEQIEHAREAMRALKMHPRDALPNTTALARADALHVELRGGARDALGSAIAHFRAALESQDPQAILATRAALASHVARLRSAR